MALRRITLIAEPSRVVVTPAAGQFVSSREFHQYDVFAAALGRHTNAQVIVRERFFEDNPEDGIVLLDASADLETVLGEHRAASHHAGVRVVLLNADRARVFADLEAYELAAAIEKHRYFEWLTNRSKETGGGLLGLKAVGKRLGASCFPFQALESENYCALSSSQFSDLPELLVRYLETYVEMVGLG